MNRKKIIIIAVLIVILIFLISLIAVGMVDNSPKYKNFTCNDTGTVLEVPVDLKVRQDQNNFGIRLTVMSTPDGNIVIQRSLSDNPFMDDSMAGASDLINSYDGDNVNGVELHTCSRTVKNEDTGEVIMVTSARGDNETVEHIVNSIRWGNRTMQSTNTETTYQAPSQEHYDAYCQYCGKGIVWPDKGERWYVCDDCFKTHEKDINKRIEEEYQSNYDDYDDYYDEYYDDYYDEYY